MNSSTGEVLTSPTQGVKRCPLTDTHVKAVEKMAQRQGITAIRFEGRYGDSLRDETDDARSAGVDYEDYDYEVEEEEEENYEENEEVETETTEETINEDEEEAARDAATGDYSPNVVSDTETDDEEKFNKETEEQEPEEPEPDLPPPEPEPQPEPIKQTFRTRSGKIYGASNHIQHREKKVNFAGVTANNEEKKTMKQLEMSHNVTTNVSTNPEEDKSYDYIEAIIMTHFINQMNDRARGHGEEVCFGQQHPFGQGMKTFGDRGAEASKKELKQLHDRICFKPISVKEMTKEERSKAMAALLYLTEKRDGSIKGRMVYNGKPTRKWLDKDDSASPAASLEGIFSTSVIDAKEGRDIVSADVPNAFIQTPIPTDEGQERIVMKITGALVDLLVEIDPETYGPYVVYEKGRKVIYVQVLRAIYKMLISAVLWCGKFRKDSEGIGFKFNNYDPCIANREVNRLQQTVRFHVDDLMSSHKDPKVNDEFLKWLNKKCGKLGKVVATRGKRHDYLGMILDFNTKGEVRIDMTTYVEKMIKEFPVKLKNTDTALSPAGDDLFVNKDSKKLDKTRAEQFHTWTAKALFVTKRARPDIQPAVAGLCTRVQEPNEKDWNKLMRMMKYLNRTKNMVRIISADNLTVLKWFVDASFAVHSDFKSHTGGVMIMGKGSVITMSQKQKLNTKSSTHSELVGVDDTVTMFYGPSYFSRIKVISSRRTFFIKTIRVLFYWRLTEERVQARDLEHSTFVIFLSQIKLKRATCRLIIVLLMK